MSQDSNCLFCQIIEGKVPSEKVYENRQVIGFKDLYPQAKEHYLFIHRNHDTNINEMVDNNPQNLIEIFNAISEFTKAQKKDAEGKGFRLVTNQGSEAGQTIFHTHFHVLTGEKLGKFGS